MIKPLHPSNGTYLLVRWVWEKLYNKIFVIIKIWYLIFQPSPLHQWTQCPQKHTHQKGSLGPKQRKTTQHKTLKAHNPIDLCTRTNKPKLVAPSFVMDFRLPLPIRIQWRMFYSSGNRHTLSNITKNIEYLEGSRAKRTK